MCNCASEILRYSSFGVFHLSFFQRGLSVCLVDEMKGKFLLKSEAPIKKQRIIMSSTFHQSGSQCSFVEGPDWAESKEWCPDFISGEGPCPRWRMSLWPRVMRRGKLKVWVWKGGYPPDFKRISRIMKNLRYLHVLILLTQFTFVCHNVFLNCDREASAQ